MDLEGIIEGPVAARHRAFMDGTYASSMICYVKFNHGTNGPLGGGDWAPGHGPGGDGFGPRRDDMEIGGLMRDQLRVCGIDVPTPFAKPYVAPVPFQQPVNQWLPDSHFEPVAPQPFSAPTRDSISNAPKPYEPLRIDTTAHSFKVFELDNNPPTPLMRLDYGNPKTNSPEHLQYGGTHTTAFRNGLNMLSSESPVLAREVVSEAIGKTNRPLFGIDSFPKIPQLDHNYEYVPAFSKKKR